MIGESPHCPVPVVPVDFYRLLPYDVSGYTRRSRDLKRLVPRYILAKPEEKPTTEAAHRTDSYAA